MSASSTYAGYALSNVNFTGAPGFDTAFYSTAATATIASTTAAIPAGTIYGGSVLGSSLFANPMLSQNLAEPFSSFNLFTDGSGLNPGFIYVGTATYTTATGQPATGFIGVSDINPTQFYLFTENGAPAQASNVSVSPDTLQNTFATPFNTAANPTMSCFAPRTRIQTATGEITVANLKPGDLVQTLQGPKPVKWVGRRRVNIAAHKSPQQIRPIRIEPGALGHNLPSRPLTLSPDHALYLNGILIPAKTLLNGQTIHQLNPASITYYHVELAEHGAIFAEGTPAETYLDTGNRNNFEGEASLTLHPDFAQRLRETKSFAPLLESGPIVETIRNAILARANIATTSDPQLTIHYDGAGNATIQSRIFIPGHIAADPRDRRHLGVKIASLTANGRPIPLSHPALQQGWHTTEPDGRWTNGAAQIPAPLLNGAPLTLTLAATGRYPQPNTTQAAA